MCVMVVVRIRVVHTVPLALSRPPRIPRQITRRRLDPRQRDPQHLRQDRVCRRRLRAVRHRDVRAPLRQLVVRVLLQHVRVLAAEGVLRCAFVARVGTAVAWACGGARGIVVQQARVDVDFCTVEEVPGSFGAGPDDLSGRKRDG